MYNSRQQGIIKLTVLQGVLNLNSFINKSIYIIISFNGNNYKTRVHNLGGMNPLWGDKFTLEVTNPSEEITLRVWNQDFTKKELLGQA